MWRSYVTKMLVFLAIGGFRLADVSADQQQAAAKFGRLEHEVESKYSHIRVRKKGNVRTLLFVRDSGEEVGETQMNLTRPHVLRIPYTQVMFATHLIHPQPKRLLLVGAGGGAMVRYIQHHFPETQLDAVELDPEVLKIADEYFDMRATKNTRLIAQDGFQFIEAGGEQYDAIYMDAFLKPSADTDSTGVPLNLKTQKFYDQLKGQLNDGGVVAFNLNLNPQSRNDLAQIRRAFPQTYVFRASKTNAVVIASKVNQQVAERILRRRAYQLDHGLQGSFSYRRLLNKLQQ